MIIISSSRIKCRNKLKESIKQKNLYGKKRWSGWGKVVGRSTVTTTAAGITTTCTISSYSR